MPTTAPDTAGRSVCCMRPNPASFIRYHRVHPPTPPDTRNPCKPPAPLLTRDPVPPVLLPYRRFSSRHCTSASCPPPLGPLRCPAASPLRTPHTPTRDLHVRHSVNVASPFPDACPSARLLPPTTHPDAPPYCPRPRPPPCPNKPAASCTTPPWYRPHPPRCNSPAAGPHPPPPPPPPRRAPPLVTNIHPWCAAVRSSQHSPDIFIARATHP